MIMTRWKAWANALKRLLYALFLASRDSRVPVLAKIIIGVVLAYALSPIDLIPDFIPLIGYLDDLVFLPLGIWLSIRLIPQPIWQECLQFAETKLASLPANRAAAFVIICIWFLTVTAVLFWVWPYASDSLAYIKF